MAQFEEDTVEVLAPVVEAELALLEVEQERVRVHPATAGQSYFGVAPEALDAVDVVAGAAGSANTSASWLTRRCLA